MKLFASLCTKHLSLDGLCSKSPSCSQSQQAVPKVPGVSKEWRGDIFDPLFELPPDLFSRPPLFEPPLLDRIQDETLRLLNHMHVYDTIDRVNDAIDAFATIPYEGVIDVTINIGLIGRDGVVLATDSRTAWQGQA
ncbi:MAG: hypothetical protein WBC11_01370, partial [Dehalococcoidia bacterium]